MAGLFSDYRDYQLLMLILLTSDLPSHGDGLHKQYVTMYRRMLLRRQGRRGLDDDTGNDTLMEQVAHGLAVVFDLAAIRRDYHLRCMAKYGAIAAASHSC